MNLVLFTVIFKSLFALREWHVDFPHFKGSVGANEFSLYKVLFYYKWYVLVQSEKAPELINEVYL